ncbi:MAG: hypothetical protein ACOCV1_00590 [Bacillota bacterium]
MFEIFNLILEHEGKVFFTNYSTQYSSNSVCFDYKKVMEYEDSDEYNVIGFYHTHPVNCNYMSDIDIETMTAWRNCFGRDLICLIKSGTRLNAWEFTKKGFTQLI